jgi:hypothetical protein
MQSIDIQNLIASRLEDMVEQVEILCNQGNYAEAKLLREEGLQLAECYDNGVTFMFLPDYTAQ